MKSKSVTSSSRLDKIAQNQIPQDAPADRTADLQTLLNDNIKCLYWIENHLLVALPKMISAAGMDKLKGAFEEHLVVTRNQVSRIEKIFDLLQLPPMAKKSEALEGLTMDGEHIIEETVAGSDARNTGLIMAGQLVENYEITVYKSCLKLADNLNLPDLSELFSQSLVEEQEADAILASLANA